MNPENPLTCERGKRGGGDGRLVPGNASAAVWTKQDQPIGILLSGKKVKGRPVPWEGGGRDGGGWCGRRDHEGLGVGRWKRG